jgi:hypothetical protein
MLNHVTMVMVTFLCNSYYVVAYYILVGKREGRRPLGRRRRGWEDNIKMDLREVG